MKNYKNQKGITLVALVITIIILIIIAGISISMVLGQDGLIEKARTGGNSYKEAAGNEQVLLDAVNEQVNQIIYGISNGNVGEPESVNITSLGYGNITNSITCSVGDYFLIQTIYTDVEITGATTIATCTGPVEAGVDSAGFLVRATATTISGDANFGYIKLGPAGSTISSLDYDDRVDEIICSVGDYFLIQTVYTETTISGATIVATCTGPQYTNGVDSVGYLVKATGTTISLSENKQFGFIKLNVNN